MIDNYVIIFSPTT